MDKKREVIINIGLSKEIYEALINESHKNKLENLNKDLKGKDKKPHTIAGLVRYACKKTFLDS